MSASHVGRETTVEAMGRTWRVQRVERAVWSALLEWAKPRIPDPLAVAERMLARLPAEHHKEIVRLGMEASAEYLSIGSPQVMRCVSSVEGMTHLMYLLLQKHQPGTTEDEAFAIIMEIGQDRMRGVVKEAGGTVPPAAEGKGQAPAA
jgi:hypothetical protein